MKLLILFILILPFCLNAQENNQTSEPLRVLFIGNSYTGWHNLPEIVAQFAQAKGKRLYYEMVIPGGRNFERHWKEGEALKKIYQNKWDAVVFQNQSYEPVGDPEKMHKYGKRLADAVAETDARVYYFLTWAYAKERGWMKDAPEAKEKFKKMQEHLNESYFALAEETNGEIIPVGMAWEIVRTDNPETKLHHDDGSHPSQLGAYLSGLVMYAALFDDQAHSMPETVMPYFSPRDRDKWGDNITVTPERRAIFEKAAMQAIKAAQARQGAPTD